MKLAPDKHRDQLVRIDNSSFPLDISTELFWNYNISYIFVPQIAAGCNKSSNASFKPTW